MLFKINLNKLEDKSAVQRTMARQGYALLLLCALFIALSVLSVGRFRTLVAKRQGFTTTALELKQQIKSLQQGEEYIGEEQVLDLYDLTNERIFWSEKLEALADIVDTSIAITAMQFQREKLYIKGITAVKSDENRFRTISSFIDSLKAAPVFAGDFGTIEFSSSDRMEYMNKNIVSFEIICLRNQKY